MRVLTEAWVCKARRDKTGREDKPVRVDKQEGVEWVEEADRRAKSFDIMDPFGL